MRTIGVMNVLQDNKKYKQSQGVVTKHSKPLLVTQHSPQHNTTQPSHDRMFVLINLAFSSAFTQPPGACPTSTALHACTTAPRASRCTVSSPSLTHSHAQRKPFSACASTTRSMWTRPGQEGRDSDWIKPSYVPQPSPGFVPARPEREGYTPSAPEWGRQAELPEKAKEMPAGPLMPERRPEPIPAGNPKEKPRKEDDDKREAPAPKEKEAPSPSPGK